MCKFICVFFFFCKQKTAYEMRISDWSSDVCSSDLHAGDGLRLVDCRVTNAVRCVPPQNKPTGIEAANCRPFLVGEIETMKSLRVVLCLGSLAHAAVLTTLGVRKVLRSEEHTSELQSLMRISYAVFCLKKKINHYSNVRK